MCSGGVGEVEFRRKGGGGGGGGGLERWGFGGVGRGGAFIYMYYMLPIKT